MDKEEIDVKKEVVIPAEEDEVVETEDSADDKKANFANLRKKAETLEKENEILRKQIDAKAEADRSLIQKKEEIEKGEIEEDEKSKDSPLKIIFERDMKEAVRQWNKKNKVSSEEWVQIKSKISLNGEETLSEIQDKIDEVYQSIPSVREKRDKALIEKGKKLAMSEFQDEELDIGGGGGDSDFGGQAETRLNAKSKTWAKGLGLSDKEIKEVDSEADSNQWKVGKSATRKFFQP